ncbi:hypothetical protein CJF32_00006517 [Rutstroemia sp. NJR-2017a WRK4]|nr:hypothetical protein CJF32_00006517 [Rutstroemia sp. NJR-2017a WRK4]
MSSSNLSVSVSASASTSTSPSPYPASAVTLAPPDETVNTEPYSSFASGNTRLCNSAVSTYIPAADSWTTWMPATCGDYQYNATVQPSNSNASPTSSLATTASGITSGLLPHTTFNGISTITEFSSTAITTTITGSAVAETQASHASRQVWQAWHGFYTSATDSFTGDGEMAGLADK